MTYWHESLENPKDSRYWLDVCWSLGVSIGLHRDPSGSQMSPRRKGLWKRLWWCLYTRDRLLSLNLRRPIGFKKSRRHKAEVPVVSLDAFDIHRYSPDILTALRDCPFLRDAEIQKRSAINFVKKSRLSLLISEVVMLRDYGRDQQISPPSPESPNSQAGEEYTDCSWEEQCQKTLEGLHDLYATIVTTNHPEKSNSESSSQVGRLTYIQCAWNQLELLASISTVHRQLMASAPEASATHASAAQNFQVSIEIATIIQDLHQANLVPYLPATAVALLVPVLGTLVLNMRSASFSLRIGAFQRFYQCMRALDTLGETYFSAQTVRLFFEGILGCGGSRLADVAAANPAFVRDLLTQHEVESLFSVSGGIGAN